MTVRTITSVFALIAALAAPVWAQRIERTIDLNGLGWGRLGQPAPIETDGNLATIEWLVSNLDTGQLRVVTETPFCAGPWFDPRQTPFQSVEIKRVGLVHKVFLVNAFAPGVTTIMSLDTPACR